MGLRTHRDVVGETYSTVQAGENGKYRPSVLYRPFPDLGGKLRAAYCFGKAYAPFAPEEIGRRLAERYDWSGSGQHIYRWGRWTAADYWLVCNVSSVMPRTPFTFATLLGGDTAVTIVAFCDSDATAKAMWLARSLGAANGSNTDQSSTVDPYVALTLQPQTSSGSIRAGASVSNNLVQSTLSSLSSEINQATMYAGTYEAGTRNSFARGPGLALKTGTADVNSRALTSTGYFIMGAETGSGAGVNNYISCAYYRGLLDTDDFNEIHDRHAGFHSAVGSGITIS